MATTITQIQDLKKSRQAVILAHNYQPAEVQEIADYVGDSYGLSVAASKVDSAELIVFCGVLFMAETAAILNPSRKVIMPDPGAGCPMAEMITGAQLRQFKAEHPGAKVVCYVNSTAEVKAESDVCCTSSNAVKIVAALGQDCEILFVPDQYLGKFVERRLGRKLILWEGFCPIHQHLTAAEVKAVQALHPGVPLMVHPETIPEVQDLAEYVLSTGEMLALVEKNGGGEYLVGTEQGILHALSKVAPAGKYIHVADKLWCPDMKKTSLEKIRLALQNEQTVITVPTEIAGKARRALENMIAWS